MCASSAETSTAWNFTAARCARHFSFDLGLDFSAFPNPPLFEGGYSGIGFATEMKTNCADLPHRLPSRSMKTAKVRHLLNRHRFYWNEVCMIHMHYGRGRVKGLTLRRRAQVNLLFDRHQLHVKKQCIIRMDPRGLIIMVEKSGEDTVFLKNYCCSLFSSMHLHSNGDV